MTDTMNKQQILEQRYLLDDEQEAFMNTAEREIERKQAVGRAALQEACGASGHVMKRHYHLCAICGGETKTDKQIADANLMRG